MALYPLDRLPTPKWPVAFQQHPVFLAALAHLGVAHRIVGWSDRLSEGSVLLMQRSFGPFVMEVASRAHVPATVAREMARNAPSWFGALALTPETHTEPAGALRVFTPAHVAEWDLTTTVNARRGAMSGAFRTALRKSARAGFETHVFAPDRSALLATLSRDAREQRASGFRALPATLILACHAVDPASLLLFQAQRAGTVLAEALVILHPPAASYHLSWTSAEGRKAQAMNQLLWTAAQTLADRGIERFDLGLVATDRAPGLARFKLSTGARVRPLGPTLFYGPLTGALSHFTGSKAHAA